jgi:hypothetical protein
MLKVKGHDALYRDPSTGAILNNDQSEYAKFREARKRSSKFETMENDLNNLKEEISEIKSLLLQLIKK